MLGDCLVFWLYFSSENHVDQLMAEWHRFKFDLIDFQGVGHLLTCKPQER